MPRLDNRLHYCYLSVDPKVFQDVQRAIKMKAKRESRLKNEAPPQKDAASTVEAIPDPLPLPPRSSHPPPAPNLLSLSEAGHTSEIDFSPSTGGIVPLHPVPSSSNHGETLDWTGSQSDDEKSERRWPLSITKRKSRDKITHVNVASVEKQESIYSGEESHNLRWPSAHRLSFDRQNCSHQSRG
jgi:hypothetical protein